MLLTYIFILLFIILNYVNVMSFSISNSSRMRRNYQWNKKITNTKLNMNMMLDTTTLTSLTLLTNKLSMVLADTSISEEDVMEITGSTSNLPDPIYAIGFAVAIFSGVAILQFSLGDLANEEGQARVRDYLQTKTETERKRGYFD